MVQALRELTGHAPGDLGEADELLDELAGVTDGPPPDTSGTLAAVGPYPVADVAPPAGLAAVPPTVTVTTVAGSLDAATIQLDLGRLFSELLKARATPSTQPDELRIGVRATPTSVSTEGVRLELAIALDVVTLPLDFGDDALPQPAVAANHPGLHVRLRLDRPAGWLVGGPAGTSGAPRRIPGCGRWISTSPSTSSTATPAASCTSATPPCSASPAATWPLALSLAPDSGLPAHLTQEDRVLLGELASALGPRPPGGLLASIFDAVVALGLGTRQPDDRIAFEVDPMEQLLLDARSVLPRLTATGRSALAAALAALGGGTVTGGVAVVPLGGGAGAGGATLTIDLGDGTQPVAAAVAHRAGRVRPRRRIPASAAAHGCRATATSWSRRAPVWAAGADRTVASVWASPSTPAPPSRSPPS